MKLTADGESRRELPHISPVVLRFFTAYAQRLLARHFHALRILRAPKLPRDFAHPLIFYVNHASWWDPLACLALTRSLFAERDAYAPIDSAMLQRYGIFRRLGFFGVEPGTARGALDFLRTARAIVASSRNVLWITPQGRFTDVRKRPLGLQDGLGALAFLAPEAAFVPIAIEYTFWTEPRPEILVACGRPIVPKHAPARTIAEWTKTFSQALEAQQDELAERSIQRDMTEWQTVLRGKNGASFIYELWQRLWAGLRGRRFQAEHLPETLR